MKVLAPPRACPVCGFRIEPALPRCPRPGCGIALDPESGRSLTFRLVDDHLILVLPFSWLEDDGESVVRRLAASGRWTPRVFSPDVEADADRTEYFLPYIRRFLFPLGDPRAGDVSCRRWRFGLDRLGGDPNVRLSLRGHDERKKVRFDHTLDLAEVELLQFGYGVGFLVLRLHCADEGATYFEQMNAAAYLRTVEAPYRGFPMPRLIVSGWECDMAGLLAYFLAEWGPSPLLPGSPTIGAGSGLPVKPIQEDRLIVYTFSCLDRETRLEEPEHCQALLHKAAVLGFDARESRLPARERHQRDPQGWMRTRWQSYSKDGGSLVVFNTDAYHERYAGGYHRTYYFDIFLLAVLQRVTLLTLFERLADIEGLTNGGVENRRLLRRVRRDLLLFKNQAWFSQITSRERGLVLWRKWQRTFETRTLFKEVNEQSAELEAFLQSRHRERSERLMKVGGFLAAAVPFVMGLDRLFDRAEWARSLRWTLLGILLLGSAVAAWYVFFRTSED